MIFTVPAPNSNARSLSLSLSLCPDKDNTLTLTYRSELHPSVNSAVETSRRIFDGHIAILSTWLGDISMLFRTLRFLGRPGYFSSLSQILMPLLQA